MSKYYKINSEDMTHRIVDNEAVILNLKTGEYYSLNKTGTFIWKLLEDKISIEDLIDKVTEEFVIDKKSATHDIKLLLKDLIVEKMIIG